MASASSSSAATSGIHAPGGSNTKNSPGIWIAAIVAIVVMFWLFNRRKS